MKNNFTIRKAERKDVGLLPYTTFQTPCAFLTKKVALSM